MKVRGHLVSINVICQSCSNVVFEPKPEPGELLCEFWGGSLDRDFGFSDPAIIPKFAFTPLFASSVSMYSVLPVLPLSWTHNGCSEICPGGVEALNFESTYLLM